MDFASIERVDGVRFSWNVWPGSKAEAARLVVPVGCMYTPLAAGAQLRLLEGEPVVCRTCRGVLNPFCAVDLDTRTWTCPFCVQRNAFPAHYRDVSPGNMPYELGAAATTVEYVLPRRAPTPPVFLLVADTALPDDEEMASLKQALLMALSLLPPNALVGLVSYGAHVHVHELGFSEIPRAHVFRGTKDTPQAAVAEALGLGPGAAARLLVPAGAGEFAAASAIEALARDAWPPAADARPLRATGAALSVALSVADALFAGAGAHVLLFVGGPCTSGPGAVVSPPLREAIRSHADVAAERAPLYKAACAYYDGLARRAAGAAAAVHLLAACLDQVGLAEMRSLPGATGGALVMSESFSSNIFRQSVERLLLRDAAGCLSLGMAATLDVLVSRELRVHGLVGPAVSANKKGPSVSETEIGVGGTTSWRAASLSPRTTYAFFFEVASASSPAPGGRGHVQFATAYAHASGTMRLRVTTLARLLAPGDAPEVRASFDQEAAAALVARVAVFKCDVDEQPDVLRWLDRMLVRLCQRFGEYRRDEPASFVLRPPMEYYPQFMFHLRRSQFLSVLNASPDETAYYRTHLLRENTRAASLMVQPTLTAYAPDGPPAAVALDSASVRPDAILLLDSFFHIVLFHGAHVAQWRDAGYHRDPAYAGLAAMLAGPVADARDTLAERFPLPMYVVCDQGGSQARFLISKLNPSTTHASASAASLGSVSSAGHAVFTDDVSLQVFMDHLAKLAVSPAQ